MEKTKSDRRGVSVVTAHCVQHQSWATSSLTQTVFKGVNGSRPKGAKLSLPCVSLSTEVARDIRGQETETSLPVHRSCEALGGSLTILHPKRWAWEN